LGAISPVGGIHILPVRDECLEAFQWLAEEVEHAKGEALVMHVEQFDGLTDAELTERFRAARAQDYGELDVEATILETTVRARLNPEARARSQDALEKLRRRHAEIARVDFFDAPEGGLVASRLARIAQALSPGEASAAPMSPAPLQAYRKRRWVTRPRPHVDRLACIWLIRRFLDPEAVIRYASTPEPDEVAFDMRDAEFGHQGNLCTFETTVRAFGLEDPVLQPMGEIIHDIDLRDGRYVHPETAGIDAILKGWLLARLTDAALESHGVVLFEGLYAALVRHQHPPQKRSAGADEHE